MLHELAHATGHERRLARPEITNAAGVFGDEDYSREGDLAQPGWSAFVTAAKTDGTWRLLEVGFVYP